MRSSRTACAPRTSTRRRRRRSAQAVERAYLAGELDLIYVAPERLSAPSTRALLQRGTLSVIAIDEAHCVSQWGHDFRPDYLALGDLGDAVPGVPRHGADRDGDRRHASRDHRAAAAARRAALRGELRPPEHPVPHRAEGRPAQAAASRSSARSPPAPRASSTRSVASRVEQTAEFLRTQGIDALPYHAGLDAGVRAAQSVAVPPRGRRRDGRDDRVRHGHRQARRALRRAHRSAEVRRGLLPGDRPRRPRRRARRRRGWPTASATSSSSAGSSTRAPATASYKQRLGQHLDAMLALCETVGCRRQNLLGYFGEASGSVRQLRHLPRGARDLGRARPGAEAAVDDRAPAARARPGVRRRAPHRHPARQLDRAHPSAGP